MLRQYADFAKHFDEFKAGLDADTELANAKTEDERNFARMKKVVEEMA